MTSDLVVLAPDKDIEQALRGIISRREALGIRPIKADYLVHPNRDPGIFHTADQLLLPYANDVDYAMVVFDCAWEGAPTSHPGSLAKHVETRLQGAWPNRACVVAIDPEVEAWVWSSSPNVDRVLDWAGRNPPLREWLRQQGLWPPGMVKPPDPKAAFERALREVRIPPSSAIFRKLAQTVGLKRCTDASFVAVRDALQAWFPTV